MTQEAREALIASADGDGRFLLNQVETLFSIEIEEPLGPAELSELLHRRVPVYDKDREGHYNLISALHKSIRGSDPQAALYYLARMLVAGEEPLYVLRRLTRAAVEDIGLADPTRWSNASPRRTPTTSSARPKASSRSYRPASISRPRPNRTRPNGAEGAWRSAKETGSLMPPMHILNAPTKLMKNLGYGKGYAYDHDAQEGFSGQDYLPEEMEAQAFYEPTRPRAGSEHSRTAGILERTAQRAATIGPRRGLKPRAKQGARHVSGRSERILAGADDELGPAGPHRHP